MIKLLIFDFDGTLADSRQLYKEAIYKTLRKHGYNITKGDVERVLGNRLEILLPMLKIKKGFGILKREINDYVIMRASMLKPCPFVKAINELKGFKKVVVSNSLAEYIKPLIRKNNLKFNGIVGPEMNSKQQIFRHLFREYGAKPYEAVYIGDRAQDVQIAKSAGCKSIAVSNRYSWDSRKAIEKNKPDAIIKTLKELNKVLRNCFGV